MSSSKLVLTMIEPSVAVVVGGADAHAGLGPAVCGERDARLQADFLERPVAVVVKEQRRRRIVGHVDIGPAVVVVVEHERREPERRASLQEAGLLGDVRERAVAVAPEERVVRARQTTRSAHHAEAFPEAVCCGFLARTAVASSWAT